MNRKEEMLVRKIKEGIVIDHIKPGKGIEILSILRNHLKGRAVLLHRASSRRMGVKDMLKIEFGLSSEKDLELVALFSPNATINWIKDWEVVRKEEAKLPEEVRELLRCPNPRCITNDEREREFITTVFRLDGPAYVCRYCGARISIDEIPDYINLKV